MRKGGSLRPLQQQFMKKRQSGIIKQQSMTNNNRVSLESNSRVICRVNKYPLAAKKSIFFANAKQYVNKKSKTIENSPIFPAEVHSLYLKNLRNIKAGKIVDQSRAISRRRDEEKEKERKDHLGQLYRKKSDLLLKLKLIDRTVRTKTQPLKERIGPVKTNSLVVRNKRDQSRSYFSRNSRYLGVNLSPNLGNSLMKNMGKHKKNSPESTSSLEKNRQVLSFIKKMNGETVERDISRLSKFHKDLQIQLLSEFGSQKKKDRKGHRASESTHFDSCFK